MRNRDKNKTVKKMTQKDLFIELAQPDADGHSRWVSVNEFVGTYSKLKIGNGLSWGRKGSPLAKLYKIVTDSTLTAGNSIDRIKLDGLNTEQSFSQYIRADIKTLYNNEKCVMLGVKGFSVNTKIEIDHKDGRKEDWIVSDSTTQRKEDFQPLCKAANDVKRQICKRCKETDKRWNAKNIKGNPYPFYEGDEEYTQELGCKGCYQFDPVEYRKTSVKKISQEVSENIMQKLYPEDN